MGKDDKLSDIILNIFSVTREMDEDYRALNEVDGALAKMRAALATSLSNSMVEARYGQLWRQLDALEKDVHNAKRILTEMGYFPNQGYKEPVSEDVDVE